MNPPKGDLCFHTGGGWGSCSTITIQLESLSSRRGQGKSTKGVSCGGGVKMMRGRRGGCVVDNNTYTTLPLHGGRVEHIRERVQKNDVIGTHQEVRRCRKIEVVIRRLPGGVYNQKCNGTHESGTNHGTLACSRRPFTYTRHSANAQPKKLRGHQQAPGCAATTLGTHDGGHTPLAKKILGTASRRCRCARHVQHGAYRARWRIFLRLR